MLWQVDPSPREQLIGLYFLTLWWDSCLPLPADEPELFEDIKQGIIRALDNAPSTDQLVPVIEDTVSSVRYTLGRCNPDLGDYFDRITAQWNLGATLSKNSTSAPPKTTKS